MNQVTYVLPVVEVLPQVAQSFEPLPADQTPGQGR